MSKFITDNYFLRSKTAIKLYNDYAKDMPIFDYHCHLSPKAIFENKPFRNLTEAWIIEGHAGDHYKWRLMRSNGVEEKYITGDADDFEKFQKFAETIERAIGNPIYQWCRMELKTFFGIEKDLNSKTAREIYDEANEKLKTILPRDMIKMSNVKVVCTTDDPIDSLEYHKLMKEDKTMPAKVLPAWRPDKCVNIDRAGFNEYIKKLSDASKINIESMDDLTSALSKRMDFFSLLGCKISDHAFEDFRYVVLPKEKIDSAFKKKLNGESISKDEIDAYKTYLYLFLGREYKRREWVQQYHINALRNVNDTMFEKLGPDSGYDCICDESYIKSLSKLFSNLNSTDELPKTICYSLNQNDNVPLSVLLQAFQKGEKGKMQLGAGWWFNDQKSGIRKQIDDLSQTGMIANFVGMLTDSRSFMSYPRHDYFRRILCDYFGELIEGGEFPDDTERVGKIVEDICYNNAVNYFNIK